MIPPKEYFKKNRANAKLYRDSYKLFIEKYHMNKPDPDGFKLNERNLYNPSSKHFFIPGKIYTFTYDPMFKNKMDYFDTRPIILCHDTYKANSGNELVVGINLNLLPAEIKAGTLEVFYEKFKSDIQNGEYAASKGKISIAAKLIKALSNYLTTVKVFNGAGIDYGFSYRQYIRNRITNPNLVEYDDWNYIPFIRPQDITGKSLTDIYKDYYKFSKQNK